MLVAATDATDTTSEPVEPSRPLFRPATRLERSRRPTEPLPFQDPPTTTGAPVELLETVTRPSSGDVLHQLAQLRSQVGIVKAKKKDGVKFKVRSAEDLSDKLRAAAQAVGLLIYPVNCFGKGYPVEDGTLAEVNLTLRIQAVSDGSYIDVMGFGLGADNQDKAGGKAGTYAWKAALIQTLLAGGAEDTDDTDTPIKGGVRAKSATPRVTPTSIREWLAKVTNAEEFKAVALSAARLSMEEQQTIMEDFAQCRQRLGLPARTPTK